MDSIKEHYAAGYSLIAPLARGRAQGVLPDERVRRHGRGRCVGAVVEAAHMATASNYNVWLCKVKTFTSNRLSRPGCVSALYHEAEPSFPSQGSTSAATPSASAAGWGVASSQVMRVSRRNQVSWRRI